MFTIMIFLVMQFCYWSSSQRNKLLILLTLKFQVECSHMADMAKEIVEVNGFSDGEAIIVHMLLFLIHLLWYSILTNSLVVSSESANNFYFIL